jgi:hypothetical protein
MGEAAFLAIKLYGLAIVISMLVAVMIWGVVITLEKIQKKPEAKAAPVAVAESAAAEDTAAGDIAVIAAAVAAAFGSVRLVRIEHTGSTGWRNAGRALQNASRSRIKNR